MRKLITIVSAVLAVLSLSGCSAFESEKIEATVSSADESKSRAVARNSESDENDGSEEMTTESNAEEGVTETSETEAVSEEELMGRVWVDESNEDSPIGYEFQGNGNLRYGFYTDEGIEPFEFKSTWALENSTLTWHIETDKSKQESVCAILIGENGLNFENPTDEYGNEKGTCRENGNTWKEKS